MKITLKKILKFLIFNTGMILVLESLWHYDLFNYIFGGLTFSYWNWLIIEQEVKNEWFNK